MRECAANPMNSNHTNPAAAAGAAQRGRRTPIMASAHPRELRKSGGSHSSITFMLVDF
jgi:hypothetical protein